MTKQTSLIILSVLMTNFVLGQSQLMIDTFNIDSINKSDSKGKKHGWCTHYFNSNWKECKKKKATYYGFRFYHHGRINFFEKFRKYKHVEFNSNDMDTTSKPILLNGNFTWYDRKGRLKKERYFKDGIYTSVGKNYFENGKLAYEADHNKKYNNEFPSYYLTVYDKDGSIKHQGYYRFIKYDGYIFESD